MIEAALPQTPRCDASMHPGFGSLCDPLFKVQLLLLYILGLHELEPGITSWSSCSLHVNVVCPVI